MFYYRRITPNGIERNEYLGTSYVYINRETEYEEFQRAYKVVFGIDHVADLDKMSDDFSKNCYGIISFKDGSDLVPLYKGDQNYIVTENGNTYSNITHK